MIIESDKDKGKYAYVDIIENKFTRCHDVQIKSNNEMFLNYIDTLYPKPNKDTPSHFAALLAVVKSCVPRQISQGLLFRYRGDGYSNTTQEILSLTDFCNMVGLKLKICDNTIGKYRGMDIKKLPNVLEKLDKKYS